jgi:hypothetical protein
MYCILKPPEIWIFHININLSNRISLFFFFFIIQITTFLCTTTKMNSAIIIAAARPAMSAISKRSMTAAFSTTSVRSFEKAHHQVAPLTDSTVYAPQGHTTATSSTTPAADATVVFSPTVNHVFDD